MSMTPKCVAYESTKEDFTVVLYSTQEFITTLPCDKQFTDLYIGESRHSLESLIKNGLPALASI